MMATTIGVDNQVGPREYHCPRDTHSESHDTQIFIPQFTVRLHIFMGGQTVFNPRPREWRHQSRQVRK